MYIHITAVLAVRLVIYIHVHTVTCWNFTSVCYFRTVYLLVPVSRCTVICTCVVQE